MSEWAVLLRGKQPWFGEVPPEVLPLVIRENGERCAAQYVAEGPGVWVEGSDLSQVKLDTAVKARPGKEYRVWCQVLTVGDAAKIYRLVERTKIRQEPDTIFTLVEFLEVLGESLGIEKAETPMDPVEFHKYVVKTLRGWAPEMRTIGEAYVDKYIETLESQDWSKYTEKEIEEELGKLSHWVPKEVLSSSVRMIGTGGKVSWDLSVSTRAGVVKVGNLDLDTSFNLKETKTIDRLSAWSYKQIPVSYVRMSDRLSKTIQRMLITGLETGENYKKVTAEIAKQTPEIVTRQQMHFLNVTAQSALGRARTQAQLLTYRDAQISVIRLAAVMDERTTPQCSFLNNQIIGVEGPLNYMESAVQKDEDPRNAFPWITARTDKASGQQTLEFTQDGKTHTFAETDSKGTMKYREGWNLDKLVPYGVGMPPYHALCRSTTYMDIATL